MGRMRRLSGFQNGDLFFKMQENEQLWPRFVLFYALNDKKCLYLHKNVSGACLL